MPASPGPDHSPVPTGTGGTQKQQLQDQEDIFVLTTLHFNDLESSHTTCTRFARNCNGPPPSPKPAPSPTSTLTKPSFSRSPSTYTRSYRSFSRRRAEKREQTKRGSVPFSQRRKKLRTAGCYYRYSSSCARCRCST
jgi:hypothetical protein